MLYHVSVKALQERGRSVALLGHFVVNVTVGESESEGRRSSPRTTRAAILHVSLLEEASEMVKTAASGSNVSLLSRTARSVPPVYAMN